MLFCKVYTYLPEYSPVISSQVEYFLRVGYYNTALKLAEHAKIEDLTNIDLFMMSKAVEESLVNRETGPCLNWCSENKSKLRKLKVFIITQFLCL